MVVWIPLCLRLKPSLFLKSELRRLYDHESHRDGNCCGDVFLRERCGAVANGSSSWRAEQQPGIGPGWPDTCASFGRRVSISCDGGAERPGNGVHSKRHSAQRRAEIYARIEQTVYAQISRRT